MAGIYIHIPFCKQACHYCNFHFSTNLALQNDFTVALLKEIELRIPYIRNGNSRNHLFWRRHSFPVPSSAIRQILESVYTVISGSVRNPEITLESNPDDMDLNRLKAWKKAESTG